MVGMSAEDVDLCSVRISCCFYNGGDFLSILLF